MCIGKIIFALFIVQVALVLAKPHKLEYDDGLYHSNDNMEDFAYKRVESCTNIAPTERKECGYARITAQECENRGCCFDDSIKDVKWCFQKEEFKCYYCVAGNEKTCENQEEVCTQQNYVCMTYTQIGYIEKRCVHIEEYNGLKDICDATNDCEVSYCTQSLCNWALQAFLAD